MAKMQFETDDEAKCKAKQAVIESDHGRRIGGATSSFFHQ